MKSKKVALFVPFLMFIGMFFFTQSAVGQTCSKTPEQIVESVYEAMANNKDLADQVSHINIQYTNYDEKVGAIKIQGWVNTEKDYNEVLEIASETSCVNRVNPNEFTFPAPSQLKQACDPPATKACGDICIPSNDTCNIGKGRSGT